MADIKILLLAVAVAMGMFATAFYVWSSIRILKAIRMYDSKHNAYNLNVIKQKIIESKKPYKCGWCANTVHTHELFDYTISGDGIYLFSKDGCSRCAKYVEEARIYYGRNSIGVQDFDEFMRSEYWDMYVEWRLTW